MRAAIQRDFRSRRRSTAMKVSRLRSKLHRCLRMARVLRRRRRTMGRRRADGSIHPGADMLESKQGFQRDHVERCQQAAMAFFKDPAQRMESAGIEQHAAGICQQLKILGFPTSQVGTQLPQGGIRRQPKASAQQVEVEEIEDHESESNAVVHVRSLDEALSSERARRYPAEIVCPKFSLTRTVIQCLHPKAWLNDEVINCYLRLLQERSNGKFWCLNSFFWPKLEAEGHQGVKRWARKAGVGVFAKDGWGLDGILIPINRHGMHWTLAALLFTVSLPVLFYYDSMNCEPPRQLGNSIEQFLMGEFDALHGCDAAKVQPRLRPLVQRCYSPSQQNTFDCGVVLCMSAEKFVKGADVAFNTSEPATKAFRRSILSSLISGRIVEASP